MTDSNRPNSPEGGAAPSHQLAAMLVRCGLATPAQIEAARALQGDMVQSLIDLGFVKEDQITAFFVKEMKIPRLNLQDYQVDAETVKMVPREICLQYRLLPIDRLGRNLTLAMVNPLNEEALEAVRGVCADCRIKPFLCTRTDFELVAGRLFKDQSSPGAASGGMSLDSLGLRPNAPAKTKIPTAPAAPDPAPVIEVDEDEDSALATMLFTDELPPQRNTGPLRSSLICLDGWELGREVEITGESHTLGRSPDATTSIKSPLISRLHARITRNAEYGQETFVITDLKSSNGTFVNNIPVSCTILRHGDRILLGDVLFKFVLLDAVEARFHKDVHQLYSIHKGTGLFPPDAWRKELARALESAPETPLSVGLVEIDGLHRIEGAHGHVAGVIVINDISDLLARCFDKSDLPCDYGAGRIAVLFKGKPLETAFPLMEDLRRSVEAHIFHHKDAQFRCTVSAGLGAIAAPGTAPETIIARLEEALRSAVAAGQNQTCVSAP